MGRDDHVSVLVLSVSMPLAAKVSLPTPFVGEHGLGSPPLTTLTHSTVTAVMVRILLFIFQPSQYLV